MGQTVCAAQLDTGPMHSTNLEISHGSSDLKSPIPRSV